MNDNYSKVVLAIMIVITMLLLAALFYQHMKIRGKLTQIDTKLSKIDETITNWDTKYIK